LTRVTFQGTPFWTETWTEGLHAIAIERNCPFGVAWTAASIGFFDEDRNLTGSISKSDNGRWAPTSPDVIDFANGVVDFMSELEEEVRSRENKNETASDSTEAN
jgi:hypothetical protein